MSDFQTFKEEVRKRSSIAHVVGEKVRLQRQNPNVLKGCCPFHQEKTPSFYVYEDQATYHCFGCGAHGDIFSFVQEQENATFPEALEKMATRVGLSMPKPEGRGQIREDHGAKGSMMTQLKDLHDHVARLFHGYLMGDAGGKARAYLEKRQLDLSVWRTFQLGYAPGDGAWLATLQSKGFSRDILIASGLALEGQRGLYPRFRDRLMFPITHRQGHVIAFGGRLLGPGEPKYLNSPETPLFHKGQELFGHDKARSGDKTLPLLVVEGYMDVIALHQMGFSRAVATLGTALTVQHMTLLWRLSPNPILCFDGDTAGVRAAEKTLDRLMPELTPQGTFRFLTLPKGMDPADFWEKGRSSELQKLAQRPMDLFPYLWASLKDKGSWKTPEDQAKLEKDLWEKVSLIQDATLKNRCQDWARKTLKDFFWSLRHQKTSSVSSSAILKAVPQIDTNTRLRSILFVFALHHPRILGELQDAMLPLDLVQGKWVALRDALLAFCCAENELDPKGLRPHLIDKGFENVIQELLATDVYMHCPAAHPDTPHDQAKAACLKLLEKYCWHKQRNEDVVFLQSHFSRHTTEETWKKFQSLRQQVNKQKEKIFDS